MVLSTTERLARLLSAAMEEQGVKELPLSEATGIPRTTLRRYLKGQSSPRVDHLHALATCLGLDPADLIAEAAA